ncbi:MAG: DoxX family protein [Bacteroidales bacterium]|jgi:putative oxidoreductase|nr:DoxX family protein [Bacteroidales bacterium]
MNKLIYKTTNLLLGKGDKCYYDVALLIMRLVLGGFMLTHGIAKLSNFEALSQNFPDPLHVGSTASLVMILFAEVGCSILLILGLFTRLALIPLMFGMIIAAFVIHGGMAFAERESPLFYLSMYLVMLVAGSGNFSIDFLIRKYLINRKKE